MFAVAVTVVNVGVNLEMIYSCCDSDEPADQLGDDNNALGLAEEIEWPDEEEWQGGSDARDLIQQLLTHDPLERLGTAGAQEVKEHSFFDGLDWESMLRQKAEFVPQLDDEEDTSYFDSESGTAEQNTAQCHREQD